MSEPKEVSKIPIKNIYYMLCYAWDMLDRREDVLLGSEDFENIYNLFARIYISGTSSLIKRGLARYYVQEQEAVLTLKGKINISDSIKAQTLHKGRMICQFDEFSQDIRLNQIVKATINLLIKSPGLDKGLKHTLLKIRLHFAEIQDVRLSATVFSSLRYNRNNYHYRMLINVSELIYRGLLTSDEDGEFAFADFVRDTQMANLYEKFIQKFYQRHLDPETYKVYAPRIKWDLDGEMSEEDLALLPEMRTDIVIENRAENTQLIIDTKYYGQTLTSSHRGDGEKVRIGHLYQVFAYISNSTFPGDIKGMLLYPTIQKEVNAHFPIGGKGIGIRTLNLDGEWEEIEERLLDLVKV